MAVRTTTGAQANFSQVEGPRIERSTIHQPHRVKTTFNVGDLVPIRCYEVIPGDSFKVSLHNKARLATPLHPFMDDLTIAHFWFFIPTRLVWSNFKKFMGAQDNPDDPVDFVVPQLDSGAGGVAEDSLHDYMGIPPGVPDLKFNSLHHRAYNLVWNEFFRAQDIQDSLVVPTDDGPDTLSDFVTVKRNKRHDFFTSCLPWEQKGDPVGLPLGTSAPVIPDSADPQPGFDVAGTTFGLSATGSNPSVNWDSTPGSSDNTITWAQSGLVSDLTNAAGATINALRSSISLQHLLERDARGGTRYTELVRAHFGVTSPDSRLQRPEYLGGGSQNVSVSQVEQTSPINGQLGDLGAYGVSAISGQSWSQRFTEHGLIICLASMRAELGYQQGLERMFQRRTKYDYPWPDLAHIGEQAVLNSEIYAQGSGDAAADAATFGFQPRYSEWRYKSSTVTGQFRSSHTVPLDAWHLAQDFGALPTLSPEFIEEDPPVDRVMAIQATLTPDIIYDALIDMTVTRALPMHGTPGLDRF